MRAYDRTIQQRQAEEIAVSGVTIRTAPGPAQPGGGPSFWGRFTQILEDAVRGSELRERHSLLRLARCGRLDVTRVFDCGSEEEAIEAWCGHPFCPPCSSTQTAKAFRAACDEWPERILTVEIPIGIGGGLELPTQEAVAAVREAWGRISKRVEAATGFARLDVVPRAVVHPDGLSIFAPLPWAEAPGTAEQDLITAVRRAAREVGLRDARPRAVSRESGALELRRCLALESDRFQERVARDLERMERFSWRRAYPGDTSLAALVRATARQWTTRLRACHQTLRRSRVLGSKTSLTVPTNTGPAFAKRRCPDHGGRCHVQATRVRDRASDGQVVHELPGEALSGAFNRHGVAALLENARPAPIRLEIRLPQQHRRAG